MLHCLASDPHVQCLVRGVNCTVFAIIRAEIVQYLIVFKIVVKYNNGFLNRKLHSLIFEIPDKRI